MTNCEFVENVLRIAETNPTYRTGGDGSDGTCDCIGLVMGAIGKKYDMHSTNYFARFQMRSLDSLLDESQLHEGSIVYKGRRDTAELNARYQAGGRYYTGDMLDYYHVGVVTAIDPLEITHCTSTNNINGIARDNSIRAWSHFGDPLDVELADSEEGVSVGMYNATVTAESGNNVRMRSRPDAEAPTVVKVPLGQTVQVLESADGWSKVDWNGQRGYMMGKFLQKQGNSEEKDDLNAGDMVTITMPRSAALAVLEAFKEGVGV